MSKYRPLTGTRTLYVIASEGIVKVGTTKHKMVHNRFSNKMEYDLLFDQTMPAEDASFIEHVVKRACEKHRAYHPLIAQECFQPEAGTMIVNLIYALLKCLATE